MKTKKFKTYHCFFTFIFFKYLDIVYLNISKYQLLFEGSFIITRRIYDCDINNDEFCFIIF